MVLGAMLAAKRLAGVAQELNPEETLAQGFKTQPGRLPFAVKFKG